MSTVDTDTEQILWVTSRKLSDEGVVWLPINCPKCEKGMISAKMASSRVICLECGAEFILTEVEKE